MLRLFNTYGRTIEEFKPIYDKEVKLYTCGPTLWNYPHIGNYRTFLFEDLLKRYLRYRGFKVNHVMNLTDLDDRIIKMCKERNVGLRELTDPYAEAFFKDLDYLRIERAEHYPRASDHIPEMVKIIEGLLNLGVAYRSEDRSVYYSISKFPPYGKLSGLKLGELRDGARVRQDDYDKESAQDFALWKAWDENDGRIFWDSTLGKGRPGWHIECSAMSMKHLGEHFDIHTGGVDNIFPHHENEIAQSEAYTGKKFVNYWLEGEHLLMNQEKMAKRLGNFVTIRDLREKGQDGNSLRYFLLSAQYRTQLNFTDQSLEHARGSTRRLDEFVARLDELLQAKKNDDGNGAFDLVSRLVDKTRSDYVAAMDNDLDTPRALAVVFEFVSHANKLIDSGKLGERSLKLMLDFMLVDYDSVFAVLLRTDLSGSSLSTEVKKLLDERLDARSRKDWATSDSIRKKLLEMGYEVQDGPNGQKLRRKLAVV